MVAQSDGLLIVLNIMRQKVNCKKIALEMCKTAEVKMEGYKLNIRAEHRHLRQIKQALMDEGVHPEDIC